MQVANKLAYDRETCIIQTNLQQALTKNNEYYFEAFVDLSKNSKITTSKLWFYISDIQILP